MNEVLQVTRSCAIPLEELEWRFDTAGGSGGQHANRARTRAEVSFDVAGSPSLGRVYRERLQRRLGDVVRAAAAESRSQTRNRIVALERLRTMLADGLRPERPRRPTKPTKASKERRLSGKRRRSDVKQLRRRPDS